MAMHEYLLDMDNDGTGTVYIKNITFTGADDEAIEWDGGNLDVRDSYFIDNDYDIYGGPDSGNGDLTLVNVVFSIGDDTQGSDRPVSIFWREPLQTLTVIICNSSFDAGGDPSIYVSTVPKGDGGEGLVDLYLANNVFNSDNDFELGDGVTVIDDESPETCQADEPTGSAAAVPYPGPFTQMPELLAHRMAGALHQFLLPALKPRLQRPLLAMGLLVSLTPGQPQRPWRILL